MNDNRGYSLPEVLVVIALAALLLAAAGIDLSFVRRHDDLHRLGRQLLADTLHCRIAALTGRRNVGLVFAMERDKWFYCMVEDRDGDGVSRRDWAGGRDVAIGPRVWLEFLSQGARVGVPNGWAVPDPSGRGVLPADDGLRLGEAAIVSFTPRATSTPSTVYFHDGRERMLAVRVPGSTGKVRMLEWRRGWPRWQEVKN
jgi:prepilin-type N-terminal cleavage/methylation domain-containing protein